MTNHRIAAFSLVELSIVLVILGLLVGGILAGQSLIRAAELRSISGDQQRYSTAVNAFRDKYFALPGDIANATSFWGKDATNCNSQSGTAASPGTCNGDGNGVIIYPAAANLSGEAFRGWQHLALAGLVEGQFSGIAGSARGSDYVIGTNSPRSRFANATWMMAYDDFTSSASNYVFNFDYTGFLAIGADDDTYADAGFLTTDEAWNVDTKLDDGRPDSGRVIGLGVGNCTTGNVRTDRNTKYDLADTASNRCALAFQR